MGVVYNGKYLEFFEVGRTELMRALGLPYTEFEKAGYFLPVVETHIHFKGSSYYDDIINIQATLSPEIKATVKFDYNIFKGNTTIALGFTRHSFLSQKTRTAVKPPQIYIELIRRLVHNL